MPAIQLNGVGCLAWLDALNFQAVHQKSYLRLVRNERLYEAPTFFIAFVFVVLNNALLHCYSRLFDPLGEPWYARCSFQFFHRERFTRPLFTAVVLVPSSPFLQLSARQTTDACSSPCSFVDRNVHVRTMFFSQFSISNNLV